jgi:hypothetical protein
MKVIRTLDKWGIEKTCHSCQSVLFIERQDIFLKKIWASEDYRTSDIVYRCPICHGTGSLAHSEVPDKVRSTLKPEGYLDSVYG